MLAADFINQTLIDILNGSTYSNETLAQWSNATENYQNMFTDFDSNFSTARDPLFIVLPITFIYILIFITGVIGNISTCIVIAKNRSMHTATNYYLFSLAISDFLLLLSGVPMEVYLIWFKYQFIFGETFCIIRGIMAETSANATVLTITSFTVERYLAICHPFLQHTMSKLSRAVKFVIAIWIVSILLAIPQALQFGITEFSTEIKSCTVQPERVFIEHSFEISTVLFFLTPMTLITVLYILIGLKLRTSAQMKRENGVSFRHQMHTNSCRQQTTAGTKRVLKMLVAVVVAFFICWAPFHTQRIFNLYLYRSIPNEFNVFMVYFSGVLYYISTCINPLLYNIMSNKFREAFKETLANICHLSARRNGEERTYRVLSRTQRRYYGRQESGDYSGSSIRDESLHSTITQKQSIDSVTLSRDIQSSFIASRIAANGMNGNDQTKTKLNHVEGSRGEKFRRLNDDVATNVTTKSTMNRKKIGQMPHTNSISSTSTDSSGDNNEPFNSMRQPASSCGQHDGFYFDNKRVEVQMTSNAIKSTVFDGTSTSSSFWRNLFHLKSNEKVKHGFCSPTHEFSGDIIAMECESNKQKMNNVHLKMSAETIDDTRMTNKLNEMRRKSNTSSKSIDQSVIKDELTLYMEEIRERERR